MLNHSFCETILPNVQPEPSLVKLKSFSLDLSLLCGRGRQPSPHYSLYPDSCRDCLSLLFSRLNSHTQLGIYSLYLHQFHCLSLDLLHPLKGLLVVRGPKLDTTFEVWLQIPSQGGMVTTPMLLTQARMPLASLVTWAQLACAQPLSACAQHTQVLSCWAVFPILHCRGLLWPKAGLTLNLIEPHGLVSWIQPVHTPLYSFLHLIWCHPQNDWGYPHPLIQTRIKM